LLGKDRAQIKQLTFKIMQIPLNGYDILFPNAFIAFPQTTVFYLCKINSIGVAVVVYRYIVHGFNNALFGLPNNCAAFMNKHYINLA
jgi:hypothetical protein